MDAGSATWIEEGMRIGETRALVLVLLVPLVRLHGLRQWQSAPALIPDPAISLNTGTVSGLRS